MGPDDIAAFLFFVALSLKLGGDTLAVGTPVGFLSP